MIVVVVEINGPPEVAGVLAGLAAGGGEVRLTTQHGSFPARLGGDDALLAEAARLLPRHLYGSGAEVPAVDTVRYWLRVAADAAWHDRRRQT